MTVAPPKQSRLPRFRRSVTPPALQLTDGDIDIVHLVARHRFMRSTHIAALVNRSLDRTNDRLCRLFHAGYIDRPRAQLDYYPSSGSGPMVYALADRGARLLRQATERSDTEWSRKNREAGRPFIEHQLEVMDFLVSLQIGARAYPDLSVIHREELIASFPVRTDAKRDPCRLRVRLTDNGFSCDVAVIPDLVFGLKFADGSRRCFMVEIDRGTMPIVRSDIRQTSFARKVRSYLTAQAEKQHERRFGWRTFRVLTVTTNESRLQTMVEATRTVHVPESLGASLFLFATRRDLSQSDALRVLWKGGDGRAYALR